MEKVTFFNEDGDEVVLPSKYEVCPHCEGSGTHVNQAIDGNGITASEMDELGPDFLEDYLSGHYDVTCEECHGLRVVSVVDVARTDPDLLAQYRAWQEEEWAYQRMCAAELRMGA